ncbi:MAG TPA: RNA 2',3'-cyclic phosphodiesterase, partial [Spirochaetia bacterium]|nr:RNA 2',3'-cyclic phosphodiesterase [Spirochaetia bacterium]
MRVFAALPLPEPAVKEVAAMVVPLRKELPGLRWVSPSAYHLTLYFFGEVEGDALANLRRVFAEPRLKRPPLSARLGPLGQFPPAGNPRVVWIGLREDGGNLQAYWELFQSAVSPLGWEPEKRGFTPHITLARNSGSRIRPGWDSAVRLPEAQFSIHELVFFQSV